MYRDPKTGNPRLSVALFELAEQLGQPKRASKQFTKRFSNPQRDPQDDKQIDFQWLRALDAEAVTRFILDEAKTKSELLELASERFSIPRAKLMRLSTPDVRSEIQSALLHEESIRIISEEAERGGANRRS